MNKIIAVLDACVLYPAPLRDFLLHLATQKLYQPKWSEIIHDEWTRSLLKNRPDLKAKSLQKQVDLMDSIFRDAKVETNEDFEKIIEELNLPDKDDRHILATAILSNAEFIITFNLKDFPIEELSKHKVKAIPPDEFCLILFNSNSDLVKQAFHNQLESLKNPSLSVQKLLENLERVGLPKTVKKLV
jgi:predicted nucleic acid-binding protein